MNGPFKMSSNKEKKTFLSSVFGSSAKMLDVAVGEMSENIQRRFEVATERRVCLGISGLSRSGKSTFITSMLNQLLEYDKAKLSGFAPRVEDRLLSVKAIPLKNHRIKSFPYEENYRRIASPEPAWPEPTVDISAYLLEIRLRNQQKSLIPWVSNESKLKLEIRDYPGEWLLDLPLMNMPYVGWCGQCLAQYTVSPRNELLGDLYVDLQCVDPFAECDESHLFDLNKRFKDFLKACKSHGKSLSLIQPGRFLIPGDVDDEMGLSFVPLLKARKFSDSELNKASETSYFKVNEKFFERYKRIYVKPFLEDFFSGVDRQLVLVDVISAMYGGPDYLDDIREAMSRIAECFSYGRGGFIDRLISPKIDRVVFAATKIDQVGSEDHESVRQLLEAIIRSTKQKIGHNGVSVRLEATAAVRSSREYMLDGKKVVEGVDLYGKKKTFVNPQIPEDVPESIDEWAHLLDFDTPTLRPPKGVFYKNHDVIPHIRIDSVLNSLLGDKCT